MTNQSVTIFMLQQLIAVSAVPAVAFVVALLLMTVTSLFKSEVNGGYVLVFILCGTGVGFGCFVPRFAKDGIRFAQWSWIAPTAVTAIIFASDSSRLGFAGSLNEYLGQDSEGLGLFLSMPMISSITYSVGAAFASTWSKS